MEFMEPMQPTIQDLEVERANHKMLQRHGATIVEFGLAHLRRDEDTGEVMIIKDKPITTEIARIYAPAFSEIAKRPELGLGRDAINLYPDELADLAALLTSMAESED